MIVGEQILDSLECAKYVTSDQIVNSYLINSLFLNKKSPQYFSKIDMHTLTIYYLKTYQTILNDVRIKVESKSILITSDI